MNAKAGGEGQKGQGGRRSAARLAAVQALYQIEMADSPPEPVIAEYISQRLGREIEGDLYREADEAWFADVVRDVSARREEIDALLNSVLVRQGGVGRTEAVMRAILRAGTYELLARPDVPARVAIDEYMSVAHAFFAGQEPMVINGVLDALGRRLRPGELKEPGGERPRSLG